MKSIFNITELSDTQAEVFNKYFIENGKFCFEGCWLRNQRPENSSNSGYIDETTQRRRYVHFYDTYIDDFKDGVHNLALADYYLYVTNTLPTNEIEEYLNNIYSALKIGKFKKKNEELFVHDFTEVIIKRYKNHPKNTTAFPSDYESLDMVVRSEGFDYNTIQERMWKLSTKMYRMPERRGNPKYTKDVSEILKYLPAQIEMGCGPSIDAKIPPLHNMHEMYKVQNHETGKFYFARQDDLLFNVISNESKMRKIFASVPIACISAPITDGYKAFGDIYKKGYFKGIVYNNNFDRIVKRLGIPEKILRIYDLNDYIAKVSFEPDVKSLICMGCHADRRQVERQARNKGLKIIFIDPEGYKTKDGFEQYLIEGPKDDDIILNITFEQAMNDLKRILK